MHKEPHSLLRTFVDQCRDLAGQLGKDISFEPYIITAHPGCTEQHARALVQDMRALNLPIRKSQDFTPTPGTISTAMYVTGLHRDSKKTALRAAEQPGQEETAGDSREGILEKAVHPASQGQKEALNRALQTSRP